MKKSITKYWLLGVIVFTLGMIFPLISANAKDLTVVANETITTTTIPSGAYTVSLSNSGNNLVIQANISNQYRTGPYNYVFGKLFVDGYELKDFTGSTTIARQTISLNGFSTGYHTAFLQLYDNSTGNLLRLIFKEKLAVNKITDRPTYNGVFNVNSTNFNYYPYDLVSNQAGPLYMEYKPSNSSNWSRTGRMVANQIKLKLDQGFNMRGFRANTVYNTRIRYGSYYTYTRLNPADFGLTLAQFQKVFATNRTYLADGNSYFFGGPVLNTTTIKTGKATKPKIKSVKVKAIKIKYHKHRVPGHYEWTGYHYVWIGSFTERYYTCKYKVTIKLKKKPGTSGIWVNGKYLKGNKKTYKTTFTPYPNYFVKKPPKKLKYKVTIKSYQSKDYGGFSPAYSKTKKVK